MIPLYFALGGLSLWIFLRAYKKEMLNNSLLLGVSSGFLAGYFCPNFSIKSFNYQ